MERPRLLALDLDGTLLRHDGAIDDRDRAAIARARRDGLEVTIATGRLASGAIPTAQTLSLEAPMVCADGTAVVDSKSGEILERIGVGLHVTDAILSSFAEHGLAPFVFMHDAIHCDESAADLAKYARSWTRDVTFHPKLAEAAEWRKPDHVAMVIGLGRQPPAHAAKTAIDDAHGRTIDLAHFPLGATGMWAVRVMPEGCNKGSGVARLATRLGIAREAVVVVGDWWNDVSMFQWAGRSFAMGQAPEAVAVHASDRLSATSITGGGVAEAIARLGLQGR
jgi:Cof subfamily protein (haloacid dehalogenase superfamily)